MILEKTTCLSPFFNNHEWCLLTCLRNSSEYSFFGGESSITLLIPSLIIGLNELMISS
jgi:hypothetical protein